MNKYIYYDHAATTRQLKAVTAAMNEAIVNNWYNISSGYTPAYAAGQIISSAAEKAGELIGCNWKNIIFTSGATESDNMVLRGIYERYKSEGVHIISSSIEHPAVYETLLEMKKEGLSVSFLSVGEDGRVNPDELVKEIRPNTRLISIMAANNETGVLQPIGEIGRIAHEHNILFHTDAVQALGHEDIDVERMNIDFLSASAHKMYGPKGIGFLYIRDMKSILPFMYGGGQQKNMRSGTLNNEAIAGYKVALEYAIDNRDKNNELGLIRDYFEKTLMEKLEGVSVNGSRDERIKTTCNLSFEGIEAESLIMMLDMKGILVSGGSACATGKKEPSRVLTAMGFPYERAKGSIRFSFGIDNTMEEAEGALEIIIDTVKYLRSMRL